MWIHWLTSVSFLTVASLGSFLTRWVSIFRAYCMGTELLSSQACETLELKSRSGTTVLSSIHVSNGPAEPLLQRCP